MVLLVSGEVTVAYRLCECAASRTTVVFFLLFLIDVRATVALLTWSQFPINSPFSLSTALLLPDLLRCHRMTHSSRSCLLYRPKLLLETRRPVAGPSLSMC